jgi:hypothetical protein
MNWKNQVAAKYSEISQYNYLGLRSICEDENYTVGNTARNSLDWDAENDCSSSEELSGTSAIFLNASWLEDAEDLITRIENTLPEMSQYNGGRHIVLLGGWGASQGTDEGERVIVSAEVLAIVK